MLQVGATEMNQPPTKLDRMNNECGIVVENENQLGKPKYSEKT
jgi:hypothetical protein